jgi:bromodomain-containing protein 7
MPLATPLTYEALGMPLARYVEETVIDPLTDGRHCLVREASKRLVDPHTPIDVSTASQVDRSLYVLPHSARALVELRKIYTHLLDMAALIREKDELFKADEVWAGRAHLEEQARLREEEQRHAEAEHERALGDGAGSSSAMQYLAFAIKSHEQAQAAVGALQTESAETLRHALDFSADLIVQLANRAGAPPEEDVKSEGDADGEKTEDPLVRQLRLNLLSLAKRAPLDKISRLPSDLVPESIRHIVPTMEPAP